MAAVSEREIELASGRTVVRVEGMGRPFVWTHGFTNSMAVEDELGSSAPLRDLPGVRLVRYDARGHGRSAPGRDDAASSWSALAGDLLELCDRLALERPIAGGASMGTATTLHAAVHAPERFAGLVLVVPPTAWETRKAQADIYRGGAGLVEARGVQAYLEAARAAFRLRPMPGFDEAAFERVLAALGALPAAELARIMRGAAASDLPEPAALREIRVPALIVATRGDPGHPLSTAERLAELLPDTKLRVIDSLLELGSVRGELARFVAELPR
jgi:pimeloyl-ACP methyl ester carboxylesterase